MCSVILAGATRFQAVAAYSVGQERAILTSWRRSDLVNGVVQLRNTEAQYVGLDAESLTAA